MLLLLLLVVSCAHTCMHAPQFAMFAQVDAFDWLLLKPLRRGDSSATHILQSHLRFAVGQVMKTEVRMCMMYYSASHTCTSAKIKQIQLFVQ